MTSLDVDIDISGPLFDGRTEAALDGLIEEVKFDVAQQGLADVHQILDVSIRNPTPYYETQLTMQRRGTMQIVHDRGVIYGPWLEGTSSRNRTSRFKGYAAFRRTAQALQRKVPRLAAAAVRRCTERMGG